MKFTLKQYAVAAALLVAAFVVSGIFLTHRWQDRVAVAQADTKAARTETQRALTEASAANVIATGATARGDSLAAVVASLKVSENRARISDSSNRHTFTATIVAAPDTCKPIIEAAQAALASAARLDTLDKARADTAQLEADSYKQSARAALVALADLTAASRRLDTASGALAKQAKGPSFLARLAPKPGFGATAGISARGGFDAVFGPTLSWSFR